MDARFASVKKVRVLAIPKIKNTRLPGKTPFPKIALSPPKNTRTVGKSVGGSKIESKNAADTKIAGSVKLAMPAIIHTIFKNL